MRLANRKGCLARVCSIQLLICHRRLIYELVPASQVHLLGEWAEGLAAIAVVDVRRLLLARRPISHHASAQLWSGLVSKLDWLPVVQRMRVQDDVGPWQKS